MIPLKTPEQIEIMDEANRIVHSVLDAVEERIDVGVKTIELDKLAESIAADFGVVPAFKNYLGYPASLCVSINDEIVHGIPGDREIEDGDLVSIDFGVVYKGFFGDAARTIIAGEGSEEDVKLVKGVKLALDLAAGGMKVGMRLDDVSFPISAVADTNGFGNVREMSGHGIGESLHEKPSVFGDKKLNEVNIRLQEGMVLAIEPMFILGGDHKIKILDDGWTAVSCSGQKSAHWEYSVAVTKDGPKILGVLGWKSILKQSMY